MSDIKLLCGDCLDLMKNIPDKSIDMILCDLPYGTTACSWDIVIPFEPLWNEYNRIIKDNGVVALFGQEPFSSYLRISNIKNYKYDWYWKKERLTNITQVKKRAGKVIETISIFYNKQPIYNPQMTVYTGIPVKNKPKNGVLGKLVDSSTKPVFAYEDNGLRYPTQLLEFSRNCNTSEHIHPTQKPVALLEYLIKTYTNGGLVLDNCMGSGSTGVACSNTNRNFIGIELDENYFKIAKDRIEKQEKINKSKLF